MTGWDDRIEGSGGNAFDVVRLVLAALVVLNHSYFLLENSPAHEPLYVVSNGQTTMGGLAVSMFFSLSGYLVTRSYLQKPHLAWFIARRAARIMPGFIAATAVGCLVFGPLASSDVATYFRMQRWDLIAINAIALKQFSITGVLQGNPLPMMQGTFWTIQYEFNCYLAVAALGLAGLLRPRFAAITFLLIAVALALAAQFKTRLPVIDHGPLALIVSSPDRWPELFPFFFAGSAFYVFRDLIPKSAALAVLAFVAILISLKTGGALLALVFCGTYLVLFVALSFKGETRMCGRRMDLSYGIYLYGWPVQQLVLFKLEEDPDALSVFGLSMFLTTMIAIVSWLLVERPALRAVRRAEGESGLRQVRG